MHQKCEKYTFSNYLGAKTSTEQKKWVHVVISKIGSQNPPWAHQKHRNTKKRPQEGQNWRQCTTCGPTIWFWAKKTKFESVRSKVCSFHTESACFKTRANSPVPATAQKREGQSTHSYTILRSINSETTFIVQTFAKYGLQQLFMIWKRTKSIIVCIPPPNHYSEIL